MRQQWVVIALILFIAGITLMLAMNVPLPK